MGERKKDNKHTIADKKRFGALPCGDPGCGDVSRCAHPAGLAAEAQVAGLTPGLGEHANKRI